MKSPPNHSHPPRRCRSPILHWRQRGLCLSATLLRYDDLPFGGPPGGQPDVDSFDPRSCRFSVGHLAGFDMTIHRHQWACDHGPNIVIAQPTDIPVHHDRPDERTGRDEGRAKNAEISTKGSNLSLQWCRFSSASLLVRVHSTRQS